MDSMRVRHRKFGRVRERYGAGVRGARESPRYRVAEGVRGDREIEKKSNVEKLKGNQPMMIHSYTRAAGGRKKK